MKQWCIPLIMLIYTVSASQKNGKDVTTVKTPVVLKNSTKATTIAPVTTTTRRPLLQGLRLPCSCAEGQCGCCTGYILDRFKQKACLNLTYDPDEFSITAAMSMNGKVLYKNSVSGKNPAPMCIRVPRLQFIDFCVQLSNIYFASRNVHMCIDAEANWEDFTLVEWSFDCIRLGASGVAVIRPEDGGGVPIRPIDAVDQTDEDYDDSARLAPNKIQKASTKQTVLPKVVFDSNVRLAMRKQDKKSITVKKLSNGDYFISYVDPKTKKFPILY